jgi:hypothetical protein
MVAGLIAGLMVVPSASQAAWEQYINEDFHFGVDFPTEPSVSSGIHNGAVSGERQSTIFESKDDGITYRAIVVDISDQIIDSGSILEEAVYIWGLDGDLIVDMSARTGPWEGAVYGRRLTIDKQDGSRATASFFTTLGRLYIFEASIDAGGDLNGPNPGRFVQTVIYNIDWDWSIWPPVPRRE